MNVLTSEVFAPHKVMTCPSSAPITDTVKRLGDDTSISSTTTNDTSRTSHTTSSSKSNSSQHSSSFDLNFSHQKKKSEEQEEVKETTFYNFNSNALKTPPNSIAVHLEEISNSQMIRCSIAVRNSLSPDISLVKSRMKTNPPQSRRPRYRLPHPKIDVDRVIAKCCARDLGEEEMLIKMTEDIPSLMKVCRENGAI